MSFTTLALLRPLGLATFTALVVFAGCGGGDDDADDDATADGGASSSGGGAVTFQAACEALAKAGCDRFTGCIASEFLDPQYDCKASAVASCLATQSSGSTVKPSDLDACATKVGAQTCTEVLTGTDVCRLPAGTRADGAACKLDTDCTSSFCAKGQDDCGTCAAVPAEGGSCVKFGCGPDRVCRGGTECVTPKKAGEACAPADACAGSLSCVAGVCVAPLETEGASCDPAGATAPKCSLLKALYCGEQTKKCLKLTPAKAGEACGFLDGQVIVCTISNFCQTGDAALAGTCVPKLAAGAACGPKAECQASLSCKNGTCVDPNAVTCP